MISTHSLISCIEWGVIIYQRHNNRIWTYELWSTMDYHLPCFSKMIDIGKENDHLTIWKKNG
jgi:hypothetical protein